MPLVLRILGKGQRFSFQHIPIWAFSLFNGSYELPYIRWFALFSRFEGKKDPDPFVTARFINSKMNVQIYGIDTHEIRGKSDLEKMKARDARDFLLDQIEKIQSDWFGILWKGQVIPDWLYDAAQWKRM